MLELKGALALGQIDRLMDGCSCPRQIQGA